MSNSIALQNEAGVQAAAEIRAPQSGLNKEKFAECMQWATMLANSSLLPQALTHEKPSKDETKLPLDRIIANCFYVTTIADAWGVMPTALAQGVSLVHGRICFEGKIVASAIEKHLGFVLSHYVSGSGEDMRIWISDVPFTDEVVAKLEPNYRRTDMRIMDGTVKDWKTSGNNSPWRPSTYAKMLFYRGAREWARVYAPGLISGIYTPDEFDDVASDVRAQRARDVTPLKPTVGGNLRLRPTDDDEPEGFTHAGIEKETTALKEAAENNSEDRVPELSTEERKSLSLLIRQCKAASTKTADQSKLDPKVVVDVAKGFDATGNLSTKFARDKAGTITRSFKSVCEGKTSLEAALQYTCGLVGIDPTELEEVK
ncbi:hypothetical protein ABE527_14340 [Brucella sp. TWI432]